MRAIIHSGYGSPHDVLRIGDVPVPVPADDEVLVRVRAASVHPDVWHVIRGWPLILRLMGAGVRRPKILIPGTDMAGVVESVGSAVTRFRPGDEVFGETTRGAQWKNGRSYAEFVTVPADILVPKPVNVTFEQAAAVPTAGLIALQIVQRKGGLKAGQTVLVNGAGGGVGTIALQVAKAHGAIVTAVDTAGKLDLLRSLGADHVIDYKSEDFTRSGKRYDLVFDIPGNHPVNAVRRAIAPGGGYVLIAHDQYGTKGGRVFGKGIPRFLKLLVLSALYPEIRFRGSRTPKAKSMALLAELLASGRLTPVIAKTFPLEETAAAVHELEQGNTTGRIIIMM